jgi:hypothetical protein
MCRLHVVNIDSCFRPHNIKFIGNVLLYFIINTNITELKITL